MAENNNQNQPQEPDRNQEEQRHITSIWLFLGVSLLIVVIIASLNENTPEARIPYSTFIDQVNSGNISNVQISGDQITGDFASPILWPVLAPAKGGTLALKGGTLAPSETISSTLAAPVTYTHFFTVFPETIGDASLLPLLRKQRITINASMPSIPWATILLTYGLPLVLLVVFIVWMGRRTAHNQTGMFEFAHSSAKRYSQDRPQVTFQDVAGVQEAKLDLQEVVDFLRNPQKYLDLGARIPRGVLLVGPPGTGKTLLARAVAGEAGVPFYSLSASEFVEMFVGVGASRVRDLFKRAKADAPAIVFVDELDAVGRRRGAGIGHVNDEREQTLNQLLVEMDGFDDRHEVILLAATNRPDVLDPALLRPGRFDRQVVVGLPDRPGREQILRIHTRGIRLDDDIKFDVLSQMTIGMSGADLASLCNEAALMAARENHVLVSMLDFEQALDKIILGAERPLVMDEQARKVIAYHEAGHVVVAWYTPAADPVHKVTIIPHGRALGVTEQLPNEDIFNYSRTFLLSRLAVMFGGRAAEEVALGEITTGAENDVIQATRLARRMISRWAMGKMGSIAFDSDEEQPFLGYELTQGKTYSEETASQIDREVLALLNDCHQYAHEVLNRMRKQLDGIARALLEQETVDQEILVAILGPRPITTNHLLFKEIDHV